MSYLKKIIASFLFTLVLFGCGAQAREHSAMLVDIKQDSCLEKECGKFFNNEESGYMVFVPNVLERWTSFSKGLSTSKNYPTFTTEKDSFEKIRMTIYDDLESCNSEAIGISHPVILTELEAVWGKMDYREIYMGDFPLGYTDICGTYDSGSHMYAFCSEKNDKRIAICLNQQNDDPEMAEEIFKTFKWTK